ncbi:hypothetical protein NKG94_05590 [Micromonospora sp. M12]
MRLDAPAKLLGTWPESVDRVLRGQAEQNMGTFRKLLSSGPTSAVGTAYVRATEVYSGKDGLHIPGDDQRVILISAVSGTMADPTATVDRIFAGLPKVTNVGRSDRGLWAEWPAAASARPRRAFASTFACGVTSTPSAW